MAESYYSILTSIGKAQIANALTLGTKIDFVKMKVGDSNGSYYNPTESQTDLVHTVWEGSIGHVAIDEENPNWINIEVLIPPDVGGFMIREYGIFDANNNMLGIAKCPETYKPLPADGSTKELNMKFVLAVTNTSSVTLKIDPTILFAKKKDVDVVQNQVNTIATEMQNARGAFQNLKARLDDSDSSLSDLANKKADNTDNARITTAKDVTGAINELKTKQNKFTEDANGKLLYNNAKVGATKASELTLDAISGMIATNVQDGIAEAFQYASNGKGNIATAITGLGADANNGMTFLQLANIISGKLKQCTLGQATPYMFSYNSSNYSEVSPNVDGFGITINIDFIPKFIFFWGTYEPLLTSNSNPGFTYSQIFSGMYSHETLLKSENHSNTPATINYYNSFIQGSDRNQGFLNVTPIQANIPFKLLKYTSNTKGYYKLNGNDKVFWIAVK